MIVKRGPQFVQLTNACRKRRSAGSRNSAAQSAHRDVGEASVRPPPDRDVSAISKPVPPTSGMS